MFSPKSATAAGKLPRQARRSLAVAAALAAAGLAMSVPAGSARAEALAPGIDTPSCNGSGYLEVFWHQENASEQETCFANGGTYIFDCPVQCWLDDFSTGNNQVQFESDNTWQPATPVGKYTTYTFPNHPGGVDLDAIKIS